MANKTITQLDTAQTLNSNMYIATELGNNTCKVSLAQIKSYCQPSGTINITTNGTHNVADYGTANVLVEPTIESLSITPTTSSQTIIAPSGTDGYAPITVSAVDSTIDQNIVAGNIKSGVSILGVTGSLVESNNTTASVTPTTSAQTITPTSPYNGFDEINVSAVTSSIDNNIVASNIKNGVEILGVTGTYEGSGITPTGSINITSNGSTDVTNYATANVNIAAIGSTMLATNKTGSTVSSGEKVWLSADNSGTYTIEKFYGDKANFSTYDTSITSGKIYTNTSDYGHLQTNISYGSYESLFNSPWEMNFKVTTSNVETRQKFNGSSQGHDHNYPTLEINNWSGSPRFCIHLPDGNGDWIGHWIGSIVIANNVTCWVKFGWDGNTYYVDASLNGINFTRDISYSSNTALYIREIDEMSIGNDSYGGGYIPFKGSMDLNQTFIKSENHIRWAPYDTSINYKFVSGTAAANIANNASGNVYIGEIIEPTLITKTITENGTYLASSDSADGFSEVIVNVPIPVVDKYKVGDRVTDDSDNDVGMVSGFFTDANDQKYAVVCLNAVDRADALNYLNIAELVGGIPQYGDQRLWGATETATTNTTEIMNKAAAVMRISPACNLCRSKSYTIDSVTYYGQLPNIMELVDIFRNQVKINSDDPTAATSSSLVIPTAKTTWSSSQASSTNGWDISSGGLVTTSNKTTGNFVIPVLEIPL